MPLFRRAPRRAAQYAFTLIELLIVVAIIAILAAIAVPNFLEAQTRAKVSRARADMRTEATGLETYRIDWNKYPRQIEHHVDTGNVWYFGNPPEWHEHVPSSMSTPVAYLNSIPDNDPFYPLVQENRQFLKPFEGRHFYWNSDFSLHRLPGNAFYLLAAEHAGAWALFSYGPDKSYYNEPVRNSGQKTAGQFINYDATNGTMSRGNIISTQKNSEAITVVPGWHY